MAARTTIGTAIVQMLRWQVDALGYTFCADHADTSRGGDVYEREARDILQSAETDDADMWTCSVCRRYATGWPVAAQEVRVVVEDVVCRIF